MVLNQIINFDSPAQWQLFFQNPATPIMDGIVQLHNYIFIFLLVVLSVVTWFLSRSLLLFRNSVNTELFEFTHDSVIETVWSITPAFVLAAIAIPSFSLLYSMDDVIDPYITVKAVGHQWYWSYEIDAFRVDDLTEILTTELCTRTPKYLETTKFPWWASIGGHKNLPFFTIYKTTPQDKFFMDLMTNSLWHLAKVESVKRSPEIFELFSSFVSKTFLNSTEFKAFLKGSHFNAKVRTSYFQVFDESLGIVKIKTVSQNVVKGITSILRSPIKPLSKHSSDLLTCFFYSYVRTLADLPLPMDVAGLLPRIVLSQMQNYTDINIHDIDFKYILPAKGFKFFKHIIQLSSSELSMLKMIAHARLMPKGVLPKPSLSLMMSLPTRGLLCQEPSIIRELFPSVAFWRNPGVRFDSYMINEVDLGPTDLRLLTVDKPLILPVQTHIRLIVTSTDVIHSWSVPSLGIKVDAVPGRLNQTGLYIKRLGTFYGQCSELCGVNHGFMPITVKAVSMDDFHKWVIDSQEVKNLDVVDSKYWEIFVKAPNWNVKSSGELMHVKYKPTRGPYHTTKFYSADFFKNLLVAKKQK